MTAIPELYACGAILAERFDSIEDWERRLGTVTGSPGYCKSPLGGRGMRFDGISDYLTLRNAITLSRSGSAIVATLNIRSSPKLNYQSIGALVGNSTTKYQKYIGIKDSTGTTPATYGESDTNNDLITFDVYEPGYGVCATLGLSQESNTSYTYINGVLTGSESADNDTTINVVCGGADGELFLNADLYSLIIFDRALTATEMFDLAKGQPFDRINLSRVSEWRPGAGPTIPDGIGGNDGTATNVTAVSTPYGKGGRFNGNGQIVCGTGSNLNIINNLTVEVIIKPSAAGIGSWQHIINKMMVWRTDGYDLRLTTDERVQFVTGDSAGDLVSATAVSSDRWYHILAVQRGTDFKKLFINGVDDNTKTSPPALATSPTSNFRIGDNQSGSEHFYGDIAYAAVYNEALTPLQVQYRYNQWNNQQARVVA